MHDKVIQEWSRKSEKRARKQLQTPTPALPPRPSPPAYARSGQILQKIGKRRYQQSGGITSSRFLGATYFSHGLITNRRGALAKPPRGVAIPSPRRPSTLVLTALLQPSARDRRNSMRRNPRTENAARRSRLEVAAEGSRPKGRGQRVVETRRSADKTWQRQWGVGQRAAANWPLGRLRTGSAGHSSEAFIETVRPVVRESGSFGPAQGSPST